MFVAPGFFFADKDVFDFMKGKFNIEAYFAKWFGTNEMCTVWVFQALVKLTPMSWLGLISVW